MRIDPHNGYCEKEDISNEASTAILPRREYPKRGRLRQYESVEHNKSAKELDIADEEPAKVELYEH